MVFAFRQANDGDPDRPIPLCGAIIIEAAVVSGLTGVGGGVFLATHTHRTAHRASPRQTAVQNRAADVYFNTTGITRKARLVGQKKGACN